jgi:hypothetical protein
VNGLVQKMVWEMAEKKRKPGLDTLNELFDATAPH